MNSAKKDPDPYTKISSKGDYGINQVPYHTHLPQKMAADGQHAQKTKDIYEENHH